MCVYCIQAIRGSDLLYIVYTIISVFFEFEITDICHLLSVELISNFIQTPSKAFKLQQLQLQLQ